MELEASLKHFSPQGMHISDDEKVLLQYVVPVRRNCEKLIPTRLLSMFARARVLWD